LISVIVPVYNVEAYLHKCVDSILRQTHTNLEIILVDDGSTDRSSIICDEFASRDSRVTVIHKANGGVSSARNAGLKCASGQYIAFVDSDDYISPDMYQIMLKELLMNNASMCICRYCYVNDDECHTVLEKGITEIRSGVYSKYEIFYELSSNSVFGIIWNKLYQASILEGLEFNEGMIHEDECFVHYSYDNCTSVVIIEQELYYYVKRQGSIMNAQYSGERLDGVWAFYDRYLFFDKKGYPEFAKKTQVYCEKALIFGLRHLKYHENQARFDKIRKTIVPTLPWNSKKSTSY